MKSIRYALALALPLALAVPACGGGGDEAPDDDDATEETERTGVVVPDSTLERDIQARFDADPRLDGEEIDLSVRSEDGQVTILGTVPTRKEMSIAREVANSVLGVERVWVDSLEVLSEQTSGVDVEPEEPAQRT